MWTQLGWAQVVRLLLHLLHVLCLKLGMKPFYWYRYSQNLGPPKNYRKKLKSGLVSFVFFFGNSQHDIILTYCESELQQPCSQKKQKLPKNWSLFYFRFISYFLLVCVFSGFWFFRRDASIFFWVMPKKYSRIRQWKRNQVLVKVGLPIMKSKTHGKCTVWRSVDHMVGPW